MRYYSTSAGAMTLVSSVTSGDTTVVVDSTAGLPQSYPFTLVLDYGLASEEVVDVTAASGATLTVTRAQDGTIAQSHDLGAPCRHGVTGRDFRESREHEAATAAHGVGQVVGTSEAQVLDNKTFRPAGNNAAVVVRTKTTNTVGAAEVRTQDDSLVARWMESGLEFVSGSTVWAKIAHAAEAVFTKTIISLRLATDVSGITGEVSGTPTGRFIRLLSGATELFYVGSTGNVRANGVTSTGNVSVTGTVTSSGNVSAPNITALGSADTALASRATALESRATAVEGRATALESWKPEIATGSVTITPVPNTATSQTVTFPTGRFSGTPTVTLTVNSSVVGQVVLGAGVTSVSSTGFQCWVTRTTSTDTVIHWIAIKE